MSREEIINALETIKKICERHCSTPGGCMTAYDTPADWKLNDQDIWRAFL